MGGSSGVRYSREYALIAGRNVGEALRPLVQRFAYVGSYRRGKPTLGDVDILVVPKDGISVERCNEAFASVCADRSLEEEGEHAFGWVETGLNDEQIWINVFYTTNESWGASLLYTTGSRSFNIAFRRIAKSRGLKLNENGVWKNGNLVPESGFSERAVCRATGVGWIPPEARETGRNIPVIPWESDSHSTNTGMSGDSKADRPRYLLPPVGGGGRK